MALATRYMSVEEAVEEGLRIRLSGTPTREAAIEVYKMGIRPDEVGALVIRGLAAVINDRLPIHARSWAGDDTASESQRQTEPQPTARGRLAAVPRHFARERWEQILSLRNYEVAEGHTKALLAFTANDAALVMGLMRARAAGYAKVAEAMRLTLEFLSKHKADTVADLPVKAKQAIAEAVA